MAEAPYKYTLPKRIAVPWPPNGTPVNVPLEMTPDLTYRLNPAAPTYVPNRAYYYQGVPTVPHPPHVAMPAGSRVVQAPPPGASGAPPSVPVWKTPAAVPVWQAQAAVPVWQPAAAVPVWQYPAGMPPGTRIVQAPPPGTQGAPPVYPVWQPRAQAAARVVQAPPPGAAGAPPLGPRVVAAPPPQAAGNLPERIAVPAVTNLPGRIAVPVNFRVGHATIPHTPFSVGNSIFTAPPPSGGSPTSNTPPLNAKVAILTKEDLEIDALINEDIAARAQLKHHNNRRAASPTSYGVGDPEGRRYYTTRVTQKLPSATK